MPAITVLITAGGLAAAGAVAANRRRRRQCSNLFSKLQAKPATLREKFSQQFQRLRHSKRRAQMESLTDILDSVDVTAAEHRLDAEVVFASVSLGASIAGTLFYAPLGLLSVPSVIYGLAFILRDAYRSAREGHIGVNVLYAVTQSVIVARGYLLPANLGIFYYFLSHKLLVMAQNRFRLRLQEIFGQLPTTVYRVVKGVEMACELDEVAAGDWIAVHAGEIIPVDGIVVAGLATVDQHRLTGEAQPAEKGEDEAVYAATVVLSGWLHVEVLEAGATTMVAQIGAILDQTTTATTGRQLWSERLSDRTVLPVVGMGALGIPLIGFDGAQAILNSHPQLRIIISSTLCTLNYLGLAAEQNILIKDGRALELLSQVDTVVFDKTGTLTSEEPHVRQIHPSECYSATTVLYYAAAAETRQSHPIAGAIVQAAEQQSLALPPLDDAQYHIGYGLAVQVDKHQVRVGSSRFMTEEGITIPPTMQQQIEAILQRGDSVVLVSIDDELAGLIEIHAAVRPEAESIIEVLYQHGLKVTMISGDHEEPTRRLAETLGIEQYEAEVLPADKAKLVEHLQEAGKTVCFVGDGINDTIAMKQSDVSISLRGATTAATDTAHIVLMQGDLEQLSELLQLTRKYTRNVGATAGMILSGTAFGLSGAYFLGFGLWHVAMINMTLFPVSVGVAMWPRFSLSKYQ